jgi:hypothetical protein
MTDIRLEKPQTYEGDHEYKELNRENKHLTDQIKRYNNLINGKNGSKGGN